jgi:hypothetical protein
MPSDRSQARVVTLRYVDGRGARLEVDRGSEHPEARFTAAESILTKGGTWRATGTDDVRAVSIERPHDDTLRRHLRAALETCEDSDTAFHLRHALQAAEGAKVMR